MSGPKKKSLFVTDQFERIYSPSCVAEIGALTDVIGPPLKKDALRTRPDLLAEVQVIFSGWGAPRIDEAFLDAVPNLELFLYGAGSIRSVVGDAFWKSHIPICSAWAANAVPVAEFTLSQILFCLKLGYPNMRAFRRDRKRPSYGSVMKGAYGSTVGLVSLGMIGRMVAQRLRHHDVHVLAYDPIVTPAEVLAQGVEPVSLNAVFERSDVVSIHTPWLKETERMIRGSHLERLPPYASFINTARGAVVAEDELIEVLRRRTDLTAVLDVTYPAEPPAADSPLWEMDNVILTPHIAGSGGWECRRMGNYMLDELKRYLAGKPPAWQVTEEMAERMA